MSSKIPDRSPLSQPELLAVRTPEVKERADAARNRAAVLEAAARLFQEKGVDGVTMDAVAAAAGVGKGTLFRRFADKGGLAVALLDERERALQEKILRGPGPLGPSGDPRGRVRAFVEAYVDYVLAHADLVRLSETGTPGARYRIGAYAFWHLHVKLQLAHREDPEADAHTLLAALAAEHVIAMRERIGPKRLRESLLNSVDALYVGVSGSSGSRRSTS
jgi:AcrR family transcriptional regulator